MVLHFFLLKFIDLLMLPWLMAVCCDRNFICCWVLMAFDDTEDIDMLLVPIWFGCAIPPTDMLWSLCCYYSISCYCWGGP